MHIDSFSTIFYCEPHRAPCFTHGNLILAKIGRMLNSPNNYTRLMLIIRCLHYMREYCESADRFSWDAAECQMIPNGAKPTPATPICRISCNYLSSVICAREMPRFIVITFHNSLLCARPELTLNDTVPGNFQNESDKKTSVFCRFIIIKVWVYRKNNFVVIM